MIYRGLGHSYIVGERDTIVVVDLFTPRELADFGDEDEPRPGDDIAAMVEAVRDWLAWIFEAGPHPYTVMRRLVACTNVRAPWLTQGMSPKEIAAVIGANSTEEAALRQVCGITRAECADAIASAYRRAGRVYGARSASPTLADRLDAEEQASAEDAVLRERAMALWLRRVWDAGPVLSAALKALYVEARTLSPDLILNMSGETIAGLFGQGRAAESIRVKQRVNDRLLRAGYRHSTLRFQKSVTACVKYAEAARGNAHRAGSVAA